MTTQTEELNLQFQLQSACQVRTLIKFLFDVFLEAQCKGTEVLEVLDDTPGLAIPSGFGFLSLFVPRLDVRATAGHS